MANRRGLPGQVKLLKWATTFRSTRTATSHVLRKVSSGDLASREDDIVLSQPLDTELSLPPMIHLNAERTKLDMRLDLPLRVPNVLRKVTTKVVLPLLLPGGCLPLSGATNVAVVLRELKIRHIACRVFSRLTTPARMPP